MALLSGHAAMVDSSAEHTHHEEAPQRSVVRGELNDTRGARRAVDANDTKFVHILDVWLARCHRYLLGIAVRSPAIVLAFRPVRVGKMVPKDQGQ